MSVLSKLLVGFKKELMVLLITVGLCVLTISTIWYLYNKKIDAVNKEINKVNNEIVK